MKVIVMTTPKAEGTRSQHLLKQIEKQLAANQHAFFNIALLIYGDDKKAAMEMLKPIAENNTLALRVVTLMRAGQWAQAEDELMDAKRALAQDSKDGSK